jgi:hypothetical protein
MGAMFLGRDELAKKDDDLKPTKLASIRPRWAPRSKTLKRLAAALALAVLVYLFISNLPTDVPIRDRRHPVYRPEPEAGTNTLRAPGPMPKLKKDPKPKRPLSPPPAPGGPPAQDSAAPPANYNGPIKFQKLLPSLQAIYSTDGSSAVNKNVLFAAASLKSAALLLPLACQMGDELRNYVHFALLGGSEIDMGQLRAVNGIGESCQVIFHGMPAFTLLSLQGSRRLRVVDARPDFAAISAADRLRQSSARALRKCPA